LKAVNGNARDAVRGLIVQRRRQAAQVGLLYCFELLIAKKPPEGGLSQFYLVSVFFILVDLVVFFLLMLSPLAMLSPL
jgi:hypothetical protein